MIGSLTVLMLVASGAIGASGLAADGSIQVEKEVKDLEFHLAALLMAGDFDTYATFLADDYTRIDERGQVQTREGVLRQFRTTHGTGPMEPTDLVVRAYGDTAILTGILRFKLHDGTGPERRDRFRKVFIRRGGRWYLVSLQGVPYEEEK